MDRFDVEYCYSVRILNRVSFIEFGKLILDLEDKDALRNCIEGLAKRAAFSLRNCGQNPLPAPTKHDPHSKILWVLTQPA